MPTAATASVATPAIMVRRFGLLVWRLSSGQNVLRSRGGWKAMGQQEAQGDEERGTQRSASLFKKYITRRRSHLNVVPDGRVP